MFSNAIVEIDESCFNTKYKKKSQKNKLWVFGVLERNGKAKIDFVDKRDKKTLVPIINEQHMAQLFIPTNESPINILKGTIIIP